MMITYKLLIYFVVGFIQDAVGIFDFKATQNGHALKSSVITFISEFAGWVVFFFIITQPGVADNPEVALIEILFYCAGGAAGNYVAMNIHNKQEVK